MSLDPAHPGLWPQIGRLIRAEAPALAALSLTIPLLRLLPLSGLDSLALLAALLLLGWRGLWRALLPGTAPPPLLFPPAWPFLAFCLRAALGIGLWVLLAGLLTLPALLLAPHLGRYEDLAALTGMGLASLTAFLLTLAIAGAGLPPPLAALHDLRPRPALLAALKPPHLGPVLGMILIGPLPACLIALLAALWVAASGPTPPAGVAPLAQLATLLRLIALLVTCATLARIWHRLRPEPPSPMQIFG